MRSKIFEDDLTSNYSLKGIWFDLSENGAIKGKNFAVDSNGNAYFSVEIDPATVDGDLLIASGWKILLVILISTALVMMVSVYSVRLLLKQPVLNQEPKLEDQYD